MQRAEPRRQPLGRRPSIVLLIAFATGFVVVKLCDILFLVNGRGPHLVKDPGVAYIQSPWSGPVLFGLVAVLGVAFWCVFERYLLRRALPPEAPIPPPGSWLVAAVAVLLVGAGLGMGWRLFPVIHHHLSWCFVIYCSSLAAVALFLSKRRLAAFFFFSVAGSVAEWVILDPAIGWWRFVQRDLFDRVPAWEPFVYGWAGIVFDQLARMIGTRHAA